MPDALSHYYNSRETYKKLYKQQEILDIIKNNYEAYRLGSQGPDFFYYYIVNHLSPKIGTKIHTEKIDEFYYYALIFIKENPEYKDMALAYLFGFITHFAFDTLAHPFIYNRTGTNSTKKTEIVRSKRLHKRYEVLLDTALADEVYKKKAVLDQPNRLFKTTPKLTQFLEKFYPYILNKLYGIKIKKGAVKKALNWTAFLINLIKDPVGYKKEISAELEHLTHDDLFLTQYFYPSSTENEAILNLDKNEWLDPVTGEPSSDSYIDLFNKAQNLSAELIEQFFELSKQQPDIENIDKIFNSKSYLTGIDIHQNQEKKYFDNNFRDYLIKKK